MNDRTFISLRIRKILDTFGIDIAKLTVSDHSAQQSFKEGLKYHFCLEEYQAAIAAYEEAFHHHSSFWEAYFLRGIALCQLGEFKKAARSLWKVTKCNPNPIASISALNSLGFALEHLGYYKDALIAYKKALKVDPNDRASLKHRTQILYKIAQETMQVPLQNSQGYEVNCNPA